MIHRFVVFNGYSYYPLGGWADFKASYPTFDEAKEYVTQWPGDWWQIVDIYSGLIVEEDCK